jgi:putative transcriptional regulator
MQTLRKICEERGISLTELGRRIGKSKQYMSELSRGNIRLTYEMAVKIAQALGTTPDDLFLPSESNKNGFREMASTGTNGR